MKNKFINLMVLSFMNFSLTGFAANQIEKCSSLSCIHAAITTIEKMNRKINPCDDFYEYSCGTFLEKTHPPDDKNVVDTLSLTAEKLVEQLLTLLSKPSQENESKLHKLAKLMYKSCLNTGQFVNNRFNFIQS